MNNYNHDTLIPETDRCESCIFIVLRSRDFDNTLHCKNASSLQIELCPPCRSATSKKERSSDVFVVKGIIRCVYLEHHLPMSNAINCLPCCECLYNLRKIYVQQQAFLIINSFWTSSTSRKGLKTCLSHDIEFLHILKCHIWISHWSTQNWPPTIF